MINNAHNDDPHYIIGENEAYANLTDSNGDVLPLVDAFCQGYAEAILWANAYKFVPCDEYTTVPPNTEPGEGMMLEPDSDAAYAYASPGKWWEDMGIEFSDAVDFLSENIPELWELEASRDAETNWAHHGQDFALTRNGHGTGFWDRGYGDVGDTLTDAAKAYGEHDVLTTEDSPTVETL